MHKKISNQIKNLGLLGGILSFSQVALAADYTIDVSHSNVEFTVSHLVGRVTGHFTGFAGEITFDPKKPESTTVKGTVETVTVNTNDKKRDDHLRSGDFFEVATYPKIEFVSTKVIPTSTENKYKIEGNLTLKGKVKSVTFDAEYFGEAKDFNKNTRVGFSATTVIDRKDFGLNWNKVLDTGGLVVGEKVTVIINLECVEVKSKAAQQPLHKKI